MSKRETQFSNATFTHSSIIRIFPPSVSHTYRSGTITGSKRGTYRKRHTHSNLVQPSHPASTTLTNSQTPSPRPKSPPKNALSPLPKKKRGYPYIPPLQPQSHHLIPPPPPLPPDPSISKQNPQKCASTTPTPTPAATPKWSSNSSAQRAKWCSKSAKRGSMASS